MSDATLDFGALADALHALVADHGRALLGDKRRTVGLLLDHRPEQRRVIRALAIGLDHRVAAELLGTDPALAGIVVDRQIGQLEEDAGLRGDIARGIVGTLAFALDMGPRPGAVANVPPVAVPAPAAATQSDAPAPVFALPPPGSKGVPVGLRIAMVAGAAAAALAIVVVPPLLRDIPPSAEAASAGYADEAVDYGVAPQADLRDDVASPTPLAITGGRRVVTAELRQMLATSEPPLLVDVLAGRHDRTIDGAHYLPAAGTGGAFDDVAQHRLSTMLARLTHGDRSRVLVIFCGGAQCWESYNAVLRAAHAGYRTLYWYRGGLAAWSAAGLPMTSTPAAEASS